MSVRTARRARGHKIPPESLWPARDTVKEAFDLKVDLDLLDVAEQGELITLTRKLRHSEKSMPPPTAPRAEVDAYVKRVESLAEGKHPQLRANALLVAARARATGRIPTANERQAILDNRDIDATLSSLSLPDLSSQVVARGIRLDKLDTRERARLEELTEKAADAEPGSIFERRREQQRLRTQLAELAAKVAPGPRKRRRVDEPGTVTLPGGALLDDLFSTNLEAVGLTLSAFAVLLYVLAIFENRRLPDSVTRPGIATLEDDDNTLVVIKGVSPAGMADPAGQINFQEALRDLERMGWLELENADRRTKIRRGSNLVAFLAAREELA